MIRLRPGDRLVIATHNEGKRAEIAALLAEYGTEALSAGALGVPEPEETAVDFAGNARLKALACAAFTGLPSLADDSGFCVAALGGAPGVLSARWSGPSRNFAVAMARVQTAAAPAADRRAWFVCALCLAAPDGTTATYQGRVDGHWTWPPRGENGFGYDAMFIPAGRQLTFGEMDHGAKEADSHRARAFAQLVGACFSPVSSGHRS